MQTPSPKPPSITDAQLLILDKLSTICAEQACMVREAKRTHAQLALTQLPRWINRLLRRRTAHIHPSAT